MPKEKKYEINFRDTSFNNILDTKGNNTVEYRAYNGTTEEIIIQNYINLSTKMMLAPSKNLIDEEFLDYKIEKLLSYNDKLAYDETEYYKVCLNDSLEFADMVFDNNLDKVYFLRQYLKDYQEESYAFSGEEATRSKTFIYK